MDDTLKEALITRFRAHLNTLDADGQADLPVDEEAGTDLRSLFVELAALRTELEERTRDLQRVTAEYANYRKRVERDRVAVVEDDLLEGGQELVPGHGWARHVRKTSLDRTWCPLCQPRHNCTV